MINRIGVDEDGNPRVPGSASGPWSKFISDAGGSGIGTVRYPRIVPKDDESAAHLKKRTLTNLYNEMPTWLKNAHRKLDEAVFAAYGWPPTSPTTTCSPNSWN